MIARELRTGGYVNPVRYDDGVVRTNPDPFVVRFRGRSYCYSSGKDAVKVSVSDDLVTWTYLGEALRVDGRDHFWAPCVIYVDGTFWMYFSDRPGGSDDPHDERLQVATAATPEGPFVVRRRFFDEFSIDPHAIRDEATGEYYLFYSVNGASGSGRFIGTSILVDRLVAMDRLAGEPRRVVLPSLDEEIFERNRFGDGRDWYTIEGATYFAHHDTAFLTYSGNAYSASDYFIGYSRAPLTGPVDRLRWTKYPSDDVYSPLIRRNDDVEGTGHNSIVKAPNLVDDWIAYHGRDADDELDRQVEQRVMRIDQLFYDGDRLTTDAPTSSPQLAPDLPTVCDSFVGVDLDPRWQIVRGRFATANRAVRSESDELGLLVHEHAFEDFVAECHLRSRAGNGPYGLAVVYHDEHDYLAVLIDGGTLALDRDRDGRRERLASSQFNVDPEVWHHLRVERTVDVIKVWADGVLALTASTEDDRPGRVGFVTHGADAELSAYAATEHVDLFGEGLRHLPRILTVDRPFSVTERGITSPTDRPLVLNGGHFRPGLVLTHEVEFVGPSARVDLDPVHTDPGTYVRVRLHPTSFRILLAQGGMERCVAEGAHDQRRISVRTRVRQDAVVVRVGGRTYELPNPAGAGFGQRAELTRATLRGFEMTRIAGTEPGDRPTE